MQPVILQNKVPRTSGILERMSEVFLRRKSMNDIRLFRRGKEKSVEENNYRPFIPAERVVPEMTWFAVILGVVLAVVFGGAEPTLFGARNLLFLGRAKFPVWAQKSTLFGAENLLFRGRGIPL